MRYIDHGGGGGVEVMRVAEMEIPRPAAGEVLIQIACAGVNRPDVLQRMGRYPPPPDACPILGLEVSGRIAAVGTGCRRWRVGDTVCALVPGGGYAEYCVTPEAHCLPIPGGLSLAEAAGLPETYFTVWATLFGQGRLTAGQTALIHGGASGIGVAAIQLAGAFGARAAATVGSADKACLCRELGADPVINYREQDFVAVLRRCGVHPDVVLDIVGGSYTARNLEVLARDGRLVQVGLLGGAQATVPLALVLAKRLTITGSTMRGRTIEEKAAIAGELEQKVWPLFAAGRLRPVLYRVFPLQQVAEAHRLMESGAHFGKIVLAVTDL